MSYSAGLLNVQNLTINDTSGSVASLNAVNATIGNFNVSNLQVSSSMNTNSGFSIDSSGNTDVPGHLSVSKSIKSSYQLAQSPFHLPTPSGPFAVDIVPMKAKDVPYTLDLFGMCSAKYWGTVNFTDDIGITMFIPSNRAGVSKNVSAQIFNNIDPSNNTRTTVDGNFLFHPDDALFSIAYATYNYGAFYPAHMEPSFVGNVFAFFDTFNIATDIDTNPATRANLIDLWNAIKTTDTYANLYKYFSIYTGKIWHNNQESSTHGYKKFSTTNAVNLSGCSILSSSTQFYTSTYTADQLPSQTDLENETGNTKFPVVLFANGDDCDTRSLDPYLITELASHGYVVITVDSMFTTYRATKAGSNQTIIDMLTYGYLGNNTDFDPRNMSGNSGPLVNKCSTNFGNANPNANFNDPSYIDQITGVHGQQKIFGTNGVGDFTYTDENGINNGNVDLVSIFNTTSFANELTHTDQSGNVSYNNIETKEKWFYTIKALINSIDGGNLASKMDFDNMGYVGVSAGGSYYSIAQNISNTNSTNPGTSEELGYSSYITDTSGFNIKLFTIKSYTNIEGGNAALTKENVGIVYKNQSNYSYDHEQPSIYYYAVFNENLVPLPEGFTVPTFSVVQPGPHEFYVGSGITEIIEPLHVLLQRTRIYNPNLVGQSIVKYKTSNGHAAFVNSFFGFKEGVSIGAFCPTYIGILSKDGWSWPAKYVIDEYIYNEGQTLNVTDQTITGDIHAVQTLYLWHKLQLNANITEVQSSLEIIVDYAKQGGSNAVLGSHSVQCCEFSDSFFRYIGPHKIETVRDDSSNTNHLNIDFGKIILKENSENVLELTGKTGYTYVGSDLSGWVASPVTYSPDIMTQGSISATAFNAIDNSSNYVSLSNTGIDTSGSGHPCLSLEYSSGMGKAITSLPSGFTTPYYLPVQINGKTCYIHISAQSNFLS
jgi:hypothetical protein